MKTSLSKSECVYQFLTRLYPSNFRAEYSEAMAQHFRDQWRDARQAGGIWRMARFWIGIGIDTGVASARARLGGEQSKARGSVLKARIPSFWFLFVAFWLPLMAGVAVYLLRQPQEYMAMARIEILKTPSTAVHVESYDPYFIQSQFETIRSSLILEPVVTELGLEKKFFEVGAGGNRKTRLGLAGAVEFLRNKISIRQLRNSTLTTIRVVSDDGSEAAVVANRVVKSYLQRRGQGVRVVVLQWASRGAQPISPNISLILTAGFLMSSLMSVLGAVAMRIVLRRNLTQASA